MARKVTERGLTKEERLYRKKEVEGLFRCGTAFLSYPFRCVCRTSLPDGERPPLRMMVSVGRRYHKRAVKRNIVKRRAREAFRLNKRLFYRSLPPLCADICFIYVANREENYETIENGVQKGLEKVLAFCQERAGGAADPAGAVLPVGDLPPSAPVM